MENVHVLYDGLNVWSLIRDIVDNGVQKGAFYICDIGDIMRKDKQWRDYFPRIQTFYAMKCNHSQIVLKVLAALGVGFDCASQGEMEAVLSLGVSPERIIFANPSKLPTHISYARQMGLSIMTFDTQCELHKMKRLYPDGKLLIRIKYDGTAGIHPMGKRFGCDPIKEAPGLLRAAKDLDLDVVGVSFHVGGDGRESKAFKKAIAAARDVFEVGLDLGYCFNILNIGGGFPGHIGSSLDEHAMVISSALEEHFPDPSVQIIAEPGRYYVTAAYTLTCTIHSIRDLPQNDETKSRVAYSIDDGIFGSFSSALSYKEKYPPKALCASSSTTLHPSSVWGPTCDPVDRIAEDFRLPKLDLGDWIVFEDMGAYTMNLATGFNGFAPPKTFLVVDEGAWVGLNDLVPLKEERLTGKGQTVIGRMDKTVN